MPAVLTFENVFSPSKKLGGRKHKQGEERCKVLSCERVKGCLLALQGSITVPGMTPTLLKGKSSAFTATSFSEKDQKRLKALRKLKDEMLEMHLPWKNVEGRCITHQELVALLNRQ